MTSLTEYIKKDLGLPSLASENDESKSNPSSLCSMCSYSFIRNVAHVMVTNATAIEELLACLTRAIEGLTKHVQEQDVEIVRLIS
ncbi:UNVERIFIED_CONTAM: hypothetical protein Sangu_0379900 [Sesamum angustifolium]|uniref:Uncharacterized protein n=1 Tax=Sesamum angustifolium TaxID=2727405 RepID=A0AAW2QS08_9LAMI